MIWDNEPCTHPAPDIVWADATARSRDMGFVVVTRRCKHVPYTDGNMEHIHNAETLTYCPFYLVRLIYPHMTAKGNLEKRKHMKAFDRIITRGWQPGKAAWAGLLATIVYSIAMEGDKFLIGNRFSDVRFIQGMLESEASSKRTYALSWLLHLLNGVALAEIYGAVAKRFLPGPNWLKGAIFGELFIIGAWWLTPLADKYHPLIRRGELPRLANWTSFFQNILRHLAFGVTLGLLYRDKE